MPQLTKEEAMSIYRFNPLAYQNDLRILTRQKDSDPNYEYNKNDYEEYMKSNVKREIAELRKYLEEVNSLSPDTFQIEPVYEPQQPFASGIVLQFNTGFAGAIPDLSQFKFLSDIILDDAIDITDWSALWGIPHFDLLTINAAHIQDNKMYPIFKQAKDKVKGLTIVGAPINNIDFLHGQKQLNHLDIRGSSVTPDQVVALFDSIPMPQRKFLKVFIARDDDSPYRTINYSEYLRLKSMKEREDKERAEKEAAKKKKDEEKKEDKEAPDLQKQSKWLEAKYNTDVFRLLVIREGHVNGITFGNTPSIEELNEIFEYAPDVISKLNMGFNNPIPRIPAFPNLEVIILVGDNTDFEFLFDLPKLNHVIIIYKNLKQSKRDVMQLYRFNAFAVENELNVEVKKSSEEVAGFDTVAVDQAMAAPDSYNVAAYKEFIEKEVEEEVKAINEYLEKEGLSNGNYAKPHKGRNKIKESISFIGNNLEFVPDLSGFQYISGVRLDFTKLSNWTQVWRIPNLISIIVPERTLKGTRINEFLISVKENALQRLTLLVNLDVDDISPLFGAERLTYLNLQGTSVHDDQVLELFDKHPKKAKLGVILKDGQIFRYKHYLEKTKERKPEIAEKAVAATTLDQDIKKVKELLGFLQSNEIIIRATAGETIEINFGQEPEDNQVKLIELLGNPDKRTKLVDLLLSISRLSKIKIKNFKIFNFLFLGILINHPNESLTIEFDDGQPWTHAKLIEYYQLSKDRRALITGIDFSELIKNYSKYYSDKELDPADVKREIINKFHLRRFYQNNGFAYGGSELYYQHQAIFTKFNLRLSSLKSISTLDDLGKFLEVDHLTLSNMDLQDLDLNVLLNNEDLANIDLITSKLKSTDQLFDLFDSMTATRSEEFFVDHAGGTYTVKEYNKEKAERDKAAAKQSEKKLESAERAEDATSLDQDIAKVKELLGFLQNNEIIILAFTEETIKINFVQKPDDYEEKLIKLLADPQKRKKFADLLLSISRLSNIKIHANPRIFAFLALEILINHSNESLTIEFDDDQNWTHAKLIEYYQLSKDIPEPSAITNFLGLVNEYSQYLAGEQLDPPDVKRKIINKFHLRRFYQNNGFQFGGSELYNQTLANFTMYNLKLSSLKSILTIDDLGNFLEVEHFTLINMDLQNLNLNVLLNNKDLNNINLSSSKLKGTDQLFDLFDSMSADRRKNFTVSHKGGTYTVKEYNEEKEKRDTATAKQSEKKLESAEKAEFATSWEQDNTNADNLKNFLQENEISIGLSYNVDPDQEEIEINFGEKPEDYEEKLIQLLADPEKRKMLVDLLLSISRLSKIKIKANPRIFTFLALEILINHPNESLTIEFYDGDDQTKTQTWTHAKLIEFHQLSKDSPSLDARSYFKELVNFYSKHYADKQLDPADVKREIINKLHLRRFYQKNGLSFNGAELPPDKQLPIFTEINLKLSTSQSISSIDDLGQLKEVTRLELSNMDLQDLDLSVLLANKDLTHLHVASSKLKGTDQLFDLFDSMTETRRKNFKVSHKGGTYTVKEYNEEKEKRDKQIKPLSDEEWEREKVKALKLARAFKKAGLDLNLLKILERGKFKLDLSAVDSKKFKALLEDSTKRNEIQQLVLSLTSLAEIDISGKKVAKAWAVFDILINHPNGKLKIKFSDGSVTHESILVNDPNNAKESIFFISAIGIQRKKNPELEIEDITRETINKYRLRHFYQKKWLCV